MRYRTSLFFATTLPPFLPLSSLINDLTSVLEQQFVLTRQRVTETVHKHRGEGVESVNFYHGVVVIGDKEFPRR